jgi:hypothetical protein
VEKSNRKKCITERIEAPENGKESSHSECVNGMDEWNVINITFEHYLHDTEHEDVTTFIFNIICTCNF